MTGALGMGSDTITSGAVRPRNPRSAPADPADLETGMNGTLLLVEDDIRIRRALVLALSDEGYRVLEASTGEDALGQLA